MPIVRELFTVALRYFWYGSNFRGFNFQTAVGDRK